MQIHAGKCAMKDVFEVDCITAHRGPITARQYRIHWKGYPDSEDEWLSRTNIHWETIRDYELQSGAYVHDWPHRCPQCDLPCSSERGIKAHIRISHKEVAGQKFTGTLADKAVKTKKMANKQAEKAQVCCAGKMLDNVFRFKYLGSTFTADGNQHFDIDERIAQAMQRCGTLRHVFGSPSLSLSLKLRLYVAAVCSVLIYGCETWTLDDKTIRRINGANSRMLIRITGRPIRDEARSLTTSHDLVRQIHKLRLR